MDTLIHTYLCTKLTLLWQSMDRELYRPEELQVLPAVSDQSRRFAHSSIRSVCMYDTDEPLLWCISVYSTTVFVVCMWAISRLMRTTYGAYPMEKFVKVHYTAFASSGNLPHRFFDPYLYRSCCVRLSFIIRSIFWFFCFPSS